MSKEKTQTEGYFNLIRKNPNRPARNPNRYVQHEPGPEPKRAEREYPEADDHEERYADFDKEFQIWGVFGLNSGHCYGQYNTEREAKEAADARDPMPATRDPMPGILSIVPHKRAI